MGLEEDMVEYQPQDINIEVGPSLLPDYLKNVIFFKKADLPVFLAKMIAILYSRDLSSELEDK